MKIFPVAIDRFSTDINRDVNRKAYLCRGYSTSYAQTEDNRDEPPQCGGI